MKHDFKEFGSTLDCELPYLITDLNYLSNISLYVIYECQISFELS